LTPPKKKPITIEKVKKTFIFKRDIGYDVRVELRAIDPETSEYQEYYAIAVDKTTGEDLGRGIPASDYEIALWRKILRQQKRINQLVAIISEYQKEAAFETVSKLAVDLVALPLEADDV